MSMLPINYCVLCGTHSAPCIFLCARCTSQGEKLPSCYDPDKRHHCTFCGKDLEAYYDYEKDSEGNPVEFKNKDFLCIGCDFASQQPRLERFADVEYLPRAIEYIDECLQNKALPSHIRYNYEQHQKYFKSKIKQ